MGLGTELAGWMRSRPTLAVMLDVDGNKVPRIHPRRLPQSAGKAPRAIVYHKISDVSEQSLAGVVRLSRAIMQFDCYGRTPDEADNLREQLKKQLDAFFQGNMGNVRIAGLEHDGDRDDSDEPMDGSDSARFIAQCDYRIMYHRETE